MDEGSPGKRSPMMTRCTIAKSASAIKETIRLVAEIDVAIPNWPLE
jgi:hypothetical protein